MPLTFKTAWVEPAEISSLAPGFAVPMPTLPLLVLLMSVPFVHCALAGVAWSAISTKLIDANLKNRERNIGFCKIRCVRKVILCGLSELTLSFVIFRVISWIAFQRLKSRSGTEKTVTSIERHDTSFCTSEIRVEERLVGPRNRIADARRENRKPTVSANYAAHLKSGAHGCQ
jgi:hypothetical protein